LVLCSACKTRQWHRETSGGEQAKTSSGSTLAQFWNDKANPKKLEEQAPALYFSLYDRFRQNPDGNFAVPEFAPQAKKVALLLQRVAGRLEQGDFPLEVIGEPKEGVALSSLAKLKTNITPQCFSAAVQRILPLLEPSGEAPLTYVSFWDGFRLASQAMSAPCQLVERLSAAKSNSYLPDSRSSWSFLPFPAIQLPFVGPESKKEHFNALLPLPIYIIGLSDRVGWVDELFMDPATFVGHDFSHAISLFEGPDREMTLGPIFEEWTGTNIVMLKVSLRSVNFSLTDYLWEHGTWSSLASKSRDGAALEQALLPRMNASKCVRRTINQHKQRLDLHHDLFDLFHEKARFIPLLASDRTPFWGEDYPQLVAILDSCKA
jgi:hypothetical protein